MNDGGDDDGGEDAEEDEDADNRSVQTLMRIG